MISFRKLLQNAREFKGQDTSRYKIDRLQEIYTRDNFSVWHYSRPEHYLNRIRSKGYFQELTDRCIISHGDIMIVDCLDGGPFVMRIETPGTDIKFINVSELAKREKKIDQEEKTSCTKDEKQLLDYIKNMELHDADVMPDSCFLRFNVSHIGSPGGHNFLQQLYKVLGK